MPQRSIELHLSECEQYGHAPSIVEHLRGHHTKLTCPRCGKSVIEHGLADHPDAFAKAAVQADLRRRIDDE